jgi:hypothetical protein
MGFPSISDRASISCLDFKNRNSKRTEFNTMCHFCNMNGLLWERQKERREKKEKEDSSTKRK